MADGKIFKRIKTSFINLETRGNINGYKMPRQLSRVQTNPECALLKLYLNQYCFLTF